MPSSPWPAPAKLNLFLRIVGRRQDGYHLLQTAFQFIDLCDELDFQPRSDGRLVLVAGAAGVPETQDLAVRAADALRRAAGVDEGVSIRLHKRIPLQAGLGGGSSDAATTLVALNCLWQLGWSDERLAALGLSLGADVPVFVHGRAAWAEGVGERLQPLDLPEPMYVIIRPPCAVSTREIFQAAELTRNSTPTTIRAFIESRDEHPTRNDCEATVRKRYPPVAAALDWLGQYAPARLTGTGSCVFAAVDNEQHAREILQALPSDWQGFSARGMNRSPLLQRVRDESSYWGVAKR